jgi:hypothetical protein
LWSTNTDSNTDSNTYSNTYSYTNTYPYSYTDTYSYPYPNNNMPSTRIMERLEYLLWRNTNKNKN